MVVSGDFLLLQVGGISSESEVAVPNFKTVCSSQYPVLKLEMLLEHYYLGKVGGTAWSDGNFAK